VIGATTVDSAAVNAVSVTATASEPLTPSPRFGLGSLLNQAATAVSKIASTINGVPVPSADSVIVTPGQTVVFTINGTIQPGSPNNVLDVFDGSLTFVSSTGSCVTTSAPSPAPSLTPPDVGGYLLCTPSVTLGTGAFSFQITFSVNGNEPPHTEANFNVACVQNTPFSSAYNLCDPVSGTVVPITPPFPPILPPPPLLPPPPPPPPLLPPPPMAPPMMAPPSAAAMPGVPVIPEADSLFLLVGGLAALGGLVALRRMRRHDDEA
jgi:hypothetical protein